MSHLFVDSVGLLKCWERKSNKVEQGNETQRKGLRSSMKNRQYELRVEVVLETDVGFA